MLTITDANGEAAFLYFKKGELIEANYAALWGKEALAQIVTWKLAGRDAPATPAKAFAPWALLHLVLAVAAVWLLSQPMEMRGTFLGG